MHPLRQNTRRADLLASVYQGRQSGITPGSNISDMCALGKLLCLCEVCSTRFDGGRHHGYARATRPPLNQIVVGTRDACRERAVDCLTFKPEEN